MFVFTEANNYKFVIYSNRYFNDIKVFFNYTEIIINNNQNLENFFSEINKEF